MATFTDNPNTFLSHTAGYVSQAPIINAELQGDAIMTERQNQGIQKIRDTISGITSLPLDNISDQQYLKQQLSGLQNQFSNMSGDFADSRFQQTLGGAITSLSSNNRIQKGIQNSLAMRADQAQMQADVKAGKSRVSNQWAFQVASSNYINNTSGDSSYNKSYFTPVDFVGKINERLKAIGSNEQITEDPFTVDANGNHTSIADAMKKVTRKGIPPEVVNQVFDSVMSDPDVSNQLRIDGEYNYRGYDANTLNQSLMSRAQSLVLQRDEQINKIKAEGIASKTANQKDIKSRIDAINDTYGKSIGNLQNVATIAVSNPSAAKTILQEQQERAGMINTYSYSWNHPSEEYLENPVFKADMAKKNFALAVKKEDFDEFAARENIGIAKGRLAIEQANLALSQDRFALQKAGKLDANGNPTTPTGSVALESPVDQSEGEKGADYLNSLAQEAHLNSANTYYSMINKMRQQMGKPDIFIKDANGGWVPNKSAGSIAQLKQEASDLYNTAMTAYTQGHMSNSMYTFGKQIDDARRSDLMVQATKNKIDTQVKNVLGTLSSDKTLSNFISSKSVVADVPDVVGSTSVTGAYNAGFTMGSKNVKPDATDVSNYILYKTSDGSVKETAKKALIKKLGAVPNSIKNNGVDLGEVIMRNPNKYANIASQVSQVYSSNLQALSPYNHSLVFKDSDAPMIKQRMLALSSSVDAVGNASGKVGSFNDILNEKDDKGQLLISYTTPVTGTGNGTITVTRGSKKETLDVPISSLRGSIPDYQGITDYQSKYGPELRINGGNTNPAQPYSLRTASNKYELKYSIHEVNGTPQRIGRIIDTRTGKDLTGNMNLSVTDIPLSQSSFMQEENELKNDQIIESILRKNGFQ